MKNIAMYFIRRPILVNFILLMNFIIGGYFIYHVPKEAFPGVSMNQIIIVTKYPGASARDVELNVTAKLEEKLSEVGNIREFRSSSIESVSMIIIFADDDLNDSQFKELFSDVQAEVDKVDDFPNDVEGRPIITSVTTEDRPIMEIAFSGSYEKLKRLIPKIEADLRKVSGISTVSTVGVPDEEIHIEVDAKKALDREIDLNSIYAAINTRNQVGTGGTLESFIAQKKIVSFNKYETAKDVLNTIVRMSPDGNGVYLRDIAEITYKPKDTKLIVRNNGKNGATILTAFRGGEDQLKVSDKVKEALSKVLLPEGVTYKLNNDVSDKARSKFNLLRTNGIIGFGLVLLILFFFLGRKAAFWTAFGIPFSIFGSMILFKPLGMSLNSVSMGAFVIVIGMIVDDAMVISERFDVNLEKGQTPEEGAANAVDRLWRPVFAASMTTITAFLPLLSLGGLPGKFIWQMPVVVTIALFVSLIDCYFLLPSHLAHFNKKGEGKKNRVVVLWEKLYSRILSRLLDFRYLVIGMFILVLMGSMFVGATKLKKDSFPQESSEGFTIKATLTKGISEKKVEGIIVDLEKSLNSLNEIELEGFTARLGTHSTNPLTDYGTEENLVAFMVYLTPYTNRERTAQQIIDDIKSQVGETFKSKGYSLEFELMRVGPPMGAPFELIISANDNALRKQASVEVKSFLKGIDGIFDIKDDNVQGKDEINLKLDYKKVAQAGLTPADIIRTLRIAFDGQVVTDYTSVDQTYDFRLRLNKETRGDFDFIAKLPIANRRGQLIKLNTMIQYEEKPSFAEINRFNGTRSTSITGNLDKKKISALKVLELFQERFKNTDTIEYTISGRPVEEAKIFAGLKVAAAMAIVGIYFILSLMFNSYSKPFLILAVIPFGIVGIFISFYFHGLPMSMFAGIGLIGLSGIVVNDSIVLIDHVRQMIEDNGSFTKEILVQAAKERLRPISLTTMSTVLAVAPTAYAIGGYDSLLSPLSLAILYGLMFGTTVVLLFIPSLYYIGVEVGEKMKGLRKSKVAASIAALLFVIAVGQPTPAEAQSTVDIKEIVKILNESKDYKIQDEFNQQAKFQNDAVESMLDGKFTTKIYKYTMESYPNPPVTLDSKKEGYGLSLDFGKMTSYGFKYQVEVAFDDKQMGTTPAQQNFSLDAMDSTYSASFVVPLYRNFGSSEYHFKKKSSLLQERDMQLKSKEEKDKVLVEALDSYLIISKTVAEQVISKESLKRFTKIHRLNKIKRKSGIITESELLISDVELINRKRVFADIASKLEIELLRFNRILDNKDTVTIKQIRTDYLNSKFTMKQLSDQELKNIVQSGSSIERAQKNEKLMESLLELGREKDKSNVDLFVSFKSYGRGDDLSESFTENTQDKYEAMLGLTWSFDVGNHRSTSEVGQILSRGRQAKMKRNKLESNLLAIYKEMNERINSNLARTESLNKIKTKQERILSIEDKRFRNGRITTLDFVKLQEAYDQSNLQIINLRYANELSAINLYKLLGRMDIYLEDKIN